MSTLLDDTPVDDNTPPPPYHDGGPVERLPSYRHGLLARHHPYGRQTPSLLLRLLLTPNAYELNDAPMGSGAGDDAVVGLHAGTEDRTGAASSAVVVGEHTNTPSSSSSSSAQVVPSDPASAPENALSSFARSNEPVVSTSRSLKRKRDEFEAQGDPE
ncbi:unnamed protein product [Peniophora sp. CBMAI 1063]|nr:unnamed protein product [Peniophora sp. CBMAI 1063]